MSDHFKTNAVHTRRLSCVDAVAKQLTQQREMMLRVVEHNIPATHKRVSFKSAT